MIATLLFDMDGTMVRSSRAIAFTSPPYAPSSSTYGALSAGFMKGVEEAMKAPSANDMPVRIYRIKSRAN